MTDSGLPKNTPGEHALVRRAASEPLAGRRVLVSGATSGLGRAMASALVEAGAEVIITGRQLARAQASAAGLGTRAVGLELDVRDETSVRAAVEHAWEQLGGVDVLVNNAGIGMRTVNPRFLTDPQPFWKVSREAFRDVLDTKATGSFLLARELVPRMLDAGGGRVVNISMNEQTMIRRGFVPYGPSGAAVEALSRVMAADLAETSVRVNILLPGGATATGMVPEDAPAEIRASLLDPAVMGPPIVWLASSGAKDVHDERIVASEFESWLASRTP
jgi:gluconate 5-dehydrogenase